MNNYEQKAKEILLAEARGIHIAAENLDEHFCRMIQGLLTCQGRIILTGIGKSGIIAQKIAATLASTGTPSFFMHPADASHGDLGAVTQQDIVLMLSNSGESSELLQLIPSLKRIKCRIFSMTAREQSTLAQNSDIALVIPSLPEADPLQLAPTVSTTMMLALGDALAIILLQERNFSQENFALFHPGGSLGKKLVTRVKDLMKVKEEIPIVTKECNLNQAIFEISRKGLGATLVLNALTSGMVAGIITDGDIQRIVYKNKIAWEWSVQQVMTKDPVLVLEDELAITALRRMEKAGIKMLPVVDRENRLSGLIHLRHILISGVIGN